MKVGDRIRIVDAMLARGICAKVVDGDEGTVTKLLACNKKYTVVKMDDVFIGYLPVKSFEVLEVKDE